MCECDRYDISHKCLHMDVFNIPRLILVLCQSGVWRTLLVVVVECKKYFHTIIIRILFLCKCPRYIGSFCRWLWQALNWNFCFDKFSSRKLFLISCNHGKKEPCREIEPFNETEETNLCLVWNHFAAPSKDFYGGTFQFSQPWAVFLLFHANFTIMIHSVSIWLTLSLAIWRSVSVV